MPVRSVSENSQVLLPAWISIGKFDGGGIFQLMYESEAKHSHLISRHCKMNLSWMCRPTGCSLVSEGPRCGLW